jgi:hypothetical protein
MRRWLKRISIGLGVVAGLLLLLAIVVQIVLWTSIPKNVAVSLVEKQLGLKISTSNLSIGWWGSTELDDVKLGLPMAGDSFLTVKSLKVHNTSLIGLALGRAVSIDSVEIDQPDVFIVQDATGQWNLQQVATLLGKALGSNTANKPTSTGVPNLPKILLTNGTVHIVDNRKQESTLTPLTVTGNPDGSLLWRYDAKVADAIHVSGEVAPGGNWQHRVALTAHNLEPLVAGFKLPTYHADLDATWTGQASNGVVTGTLAIAKASASDVPQAGNVSISGGIGFTVAGGVVTANPSKLVIDTSLAAVPTITLDSGSVFFDPAGLHVKQVRVAALGGQSQVTADYNPATMAADLRADWAGLSLQQQTSQAGYLTLSLRQPFPNQPVIKLALKTNGTVGTAVTEIGGAAPDTWATDLELDGHGTSWGDIDWVFAAPTLRYDSGGKTYSLANLSAHVSERVPPGKTQPFIVLTDLSVPRTDLSGRVADITLNSSGQVDFNGNKPWNLNLAGGFKASVNDTDIPVIIDLQAGGDAEYFQLKNLQVAIADTILKIDGRYNGRKKDPKTSVDPTPVSLHVALSETPRLAPDAPVKGSLTGGFDIVGDLFKDDPKMAGRQTWHPYLKIDGQLLSNDLVVLKHPIGDIAIKLAGSVASPTRPDGSYSPAETHIKSTEFYLLNAPWDMAVDYVGPETGVAVNLETKNLAVSELAAVADQTGIEGRIASAKWSAVFRGLSLDKMDFRSDYHLTGLAAAGLVVDTVDATAAVHRGSFTLGPVVAKSGAGVATVSAAMDLHTARHLTAAVSVKNWPDKISDAVEARVNAELPRFDLDLKNKQATGTVAASTDLLLHNTVGTVTLAHADLAADIRNRLVTLTSVSGHVLNGPFAGSARIDLDKPLEATGRFTWQDIDFEKLAILNPKAMDGLAGFSSGTVMMAPALGVEPRPIGPVRIDVNVSTDNARYRTVTIGGKGLLALHAVAYADVDRFVLDHSTLFVAGGTVHLWGRVGRGLSAKTILADFQNLDLNQLAHVAPNVQGEMPGILNGRIGLISSGFDITKLTGDGHVDLTQTDLVNLGPIAALYNVLNAGGGGVQPTGSGSVDLTFEQGSMQITTFKFYNRGIEATAIASVGPIDMDNVMNTPINGQVRGSARLLKGSQLSILADFDQLASAAQTSLTTIDVNGTLGDHTTGQAGLNAIGKAVGQVLGGGGGKSGK